MSTSNVRAWWSKHFLGAELIAAVIVTVIFVGWSVLGGGIQSIDALLRDNRSAVYGALASVSGSLLGFAITAASIIMGYSTNDRMTIIRESAQYETLWKVFTATIRALAFATVVALLGLIVDRDTSPVSFILYLTTGAITLAIFRLSRCLWAFENVVAIISKSAPAN